MHDQGEHPADVARINRHGFVSFFSKDALAGSLSTRERLTSSVSE
jgi:hypothetical protein